MEEEGVYVKVTINNSYAYTGTLATSVEKRERQMGRIEGGSSRFHIVCHGHHQQCQFSVRACVHTPVFNDRQTLATEKMRDPETDG